MTSSVLAIDIGGTSSKLGIFIPPDQLRFIESIPTTGPSDSFGAALAGAAQRTIAVGPHPVDRIGVAVAGFVSDARDRMIYNSNLPWLENYPLQEFLESRFNVPVAVDSDSNAAALAEFYLGVGRGSKRFLCLTIGTGLGVGMIVGNEPLRFAYGCMGDAGHVIVEPNGPLCPCGGHGCAEGLLSAPALGERFRQQINHSQPRSLRDVIEAGREGNGAALSVLQQAGEWLGLATASLANIFFPDRVAFAGGLAEAGDLVLARTQRTFEHSASIFARERVTLSRAMLGAMATLYGAGFTALTPTQTI